MTETDGNEYREQRLEHMRRLRDLGIKPYGTAFERSGRLADVRAGYEEERRVRVAGRLMTVRNMGKSTFADLNDGSDRLQVYAKKNVLGDASYEAFSLLDMGDLVGVEGTLFTTRTGEMTVKVERWTMLGKALLPLPEKWHGLKDTEARYRQRYLDLVANPEARRVFEKRVEIIRHVRRYLQERGFLEVETPMMQPQAGGAAAKPFVTRYESLHTDMFLRIAPELYLKRLLVGGFDKVFELNRNFRNEGISRTHNPEFTMLEIYEAYTGVEGMKTLVQGLITEAARAVFGTLQVGTQDEPIDLATPWTEKTYRELVVQRMGADWYDLDPQEAAARLEREGVSVDPAWPPVLITHEVNEKLIEKSLRQPTFVTRFPAELIPLARACEDDPSVADVFELVIAGQEVAPAYTEMNDPIEQRRRLEQQAGEDTEKVDEDFITALEHGMPPVGGMGIGIDRLVMILCGVDTIRDVILFPQLRPKT